MEQIVVKIEPEELVNCFEGDISMNYVKPRPTSPDQEMPSTSGMEIKQEIKEELYDEALLDEGYIITLPQKYLNIPAHNFGSKINDADVKSDNSDYERKDFSCNIKKEERDSDFSEDDKNSSHNGNNEEKDNDEAKFEMQIRVEYHGVQYDESGTDSEVVNNKVQAKKILSKSGKESLEKQSLKRRGKDDNKKLFKCGICLKEYQTKENLFKHKKYVHKKDGLEQFECNKCDYVTVRKNNLKSHLKIHDKKNYLKCIFCQYVTAQLQHLNAHILSKHKLENEGANKIKITSKIHTCPKCSYSTVHKTSYDNHLKVCLKLKNVKWYDCQICHYKTIQKSHLTRHTKTHNTRDST